MPVFTIVQCEVCQKQAQFKGMNYEKSNLPGFVLTYTIDDTGNPIREFQCGACATEATAFRQTQEKRMQDEFVAFCTARKNRRNK